MGLGITLTLGALDYLIPGPISLTLYYLLIVVFVGWAAGKWPALVVSVVSVAVMMTVDAGLHRGTTQNFWVFAWDESTRFIVFSLAGWLTAETTQLTRRLNNLVDERSAQWKAETERHGATATRLQEALERFEQVANNVTQVFWLTDLARSETAYVSPAYEQLWGRKCEDLYRDPQSWLEAVHPQDREEVARRCRTEPFTGSYDQEYRIIRPDGQTRWVRTRVSPVSNTRGEVYRLAGVAEDITARKQVEIAREVFLSLGTQLSAAGTPLEAGRAIFASADQLWEWDSATLDLYSPDEDLMRPVVFCDVVDGQRREVPPERPIAPPGDRMRSILQEGAKLILRRQGEVRLADALTFGDRSRLSASIMFTPLHLKGRAVGVLSIQSYTPNAYTEEDLRTLQALADYCGAALERIHAEEALRQAHDSLEHRVQERTEALQASNLALARTNAILQAISRGTDNLICVKDLQGRIIMANPAMCRFLGKAESELIGTDDLDTLPSPEQAARIRENDRRIMTAGRSEIVEETIDQPDRRWHCLFTKSPYRDANGVVIGLIGIGLDVTEREQAQRSLRDAHETLETRVQERTADLQAANSALRQSEESLRVFLDALPEPAVLLARDAKVLHANLGVARRFGRPVDELIGRSLFEFTPPEIADLRKTMFDRVISTGKLARFEDSRNGRHFINFIAPILDAAGQTTRAAVFALDITERKRAETMKEAFLALGHKLSSARMPREAGEAILAAADCLWEWHCATLDICSPEPDCIVPVLNYDLVDGERREVSGVTPSGALTTRMRRIFQNGPELILRQQPAQATDDSLMIGDTSRCCSSIMCVPLRRDRQPLGVLSIQSYTPNAYSEEDLQALQALADYCSGALERIRAETALRESEQTYRALIETTGTGYLILDLQRQVVDANAEYIRLTGHKTLQEIAGRPVAEWTAPHDRQRHAAELENCVRTGTARILDLDCAGPDGIDRPIEMNATLVVTSKGGRILCLCWDITERKRAEEALRQREEQNRTILATAMDGFFAVDFALDPRGAITEVNDAYCRMTGYRREDLLQMRLTDLDVDETPDAIAEHGRRIMATGGERFEARHRCKDGHTIEVDISASNLAGSDAKTFGFIRDITERKRAEAALRASEQRYRTLFELSPNSIILEDTDGNILDVNQRICQSFGYSRDELLRLNVRCFAPPEDHAAVETNLTLLRAGQPLEHEVWNVRKNGDRRLMRLSEQPITLPDNGRVILVVATDITESRETENALRESEVRHRVLFENSTVPLWEEDFSEVQACFEKLRADGVTDWKAYFEDHPEEVRRCASLVKVLAVNSEAVACWQAATSDDLIRHPTRYFTDESWSVIRDELVAFAEGRTRFQSEGPLLTARGELKRLIIHRTVIPGHTRTLSRVLVSFVDITERKRAEQALRASEERYRALAESSPDAIFIIDRDLVVRYVNSQAASLWRGSVQDIIGRRQAELFPPEVAAQHEETLRKVLQTGESFQRDECIPYPKGELWNEVRLVPLRDDRNAIISVMGVIRDITDRKQAESALRESELRYRVLFENSTVPLWEEDFSEVQNCFNQLRAGGITDWRAYFEDHPGEVSRLAALVKVLAVNSEAVACWEAASSEDLVRNLTDYFTDESWWVFREELIALAEGRTRFESEGPIRTSRGDLKRLIIHLSVVPGHTRTLARVLASFVDITERKRAEIALRASEQRYRTLFDLSPDGILLEDAQGRILDVNRAICQTFGYSREEFLGLTVHRLATPENLPEVDAHLARLKTGHRLEHEVWNRRKNGDLCLMRLNEQPITLPDGAQVILVIARDVTERRKTQEALRESEGRYRSLVNNLNVGIYRNTPGPHARFIQANPALARMHGYSSPEELQNTPVTALYQDPAERETFLAELRRLGTVSNYELRLKRKDGTPIWGSVTATIHRDSKGQVDWIDGVMEDITERKRAEAALRENENLLRTFYDSPGALRGIVELLEDDVLVLSVNTAQAAAYGRSVENVRSIRASQLGIIRPIIDLWAGKFRESRRLNTQVTFEYSTHFRAPDSWGLATVAPLGLGPSGRPRFGYVAMDITERKKAERELAAALELNRTLIQASTVGIAAYKASGECILANEALARLAGGTVEQLMQQNFRQLKSWRRDGMLKLAREVLKTQEPRQKDFRSITTFGKDASVLFHFAPFVIDSELHLLTLVTDISERKRAEFLLEVQRDLGVNLSLTSDLNAALDHLLDTTMRLGGIDSGGVHLINAATGTMDLASHRGVSASFVKAVSRWTAGSPQMRLIRQGQPIFPTYDKLLKRLGQRRRQENLRAAALLPLSHKGNIIGALALASHTKDEIPAQTQVVVETIAAQASGAIARIQAESERRRLEQQILEISDREQARIGQDIHDGLCQHLVSLGFDTNSLAERLGRSGRPEATLAQRAARYLDQAITEARQLSRGLFPIRLEAEGLGPALEELAHVAAERFRVRCSLVSRKAVFVKSSTVATHLYRIAQEAVTNAAKHSRARTISISLHSRADQLELKVEDDGTGIGSETSRKKKGMGLHIMDYRARSIGGTLRFSPAHPRGTVVSCCVPRSVS